MTSPADRPGIPEMPNPASEPTPIPTPMPEQAPGYDSPPIYDPPVNPDTPGLPVPDPVPNSDTPGLGIPSPAIDLKDGKWEVETASLTPCQVSFPNPRFAATEQEKAPLERQAGPSFVAMLVDLLSIRPKAANEGNCGPPVPVSTYYAQSEFIQCDLLHIVPA